MATWTPISSLDIRVGDAIRYDYWCPRLDAAGQPMLKPAVPGKSREPVRASVTIVGRVICRGYVQGHWEREMIVERTNLGRVTQAAELPSPFHIVRESHMRRIHRADDLGLGAICDHAGAGLMKGLIRSAAGGDDTDDAAVARVAACVEPDELERARIEGRRPRRIGSERARFWLRDGTLSSETVIRQLDGRIPIPETDEPELTNR